MADTLDTMSPDELRAWVKKLRSLFRVWGGETNYKRACGLAAQMRAMLGETTAEDEIAALKVLEAADGANS